MTSYFWKSHYKNAQNQTRWISYNFTNQMCWSTVDWLIDRLILLLINAVDWLIDWILILLLINAVDWLIWYDMIFTFNRHISPNQRPLWNVPCTNLDGEIASAWKGLKRNSATDSTAPARGSSQHRSHEFRASLLPAPTKSKEIKFKPKFKSAKKQIRIQ